MNKRTVLITGAGGFIARHAVGEFASRGWRTVGLGRSDPNQQSALFDTFHLHDLSGGERIPPLLDRYAPDAVIHLAAPSSVPQSMRSPLSDFTAHVIPTANLLEAVRISGSATRVIIVSSAAVYGDPATRPVGETSPLEPVSSYGFHKLQQEVLLDEYRTLYGVRGCKVRIFSTYGEYLRRLAVWDITRRAILGDRTVLGTGHETRDYLYAGDVARALACIVENATCDGEAINVGSGDEIPIRTLAAEIFRIVDLRGEPEFTGAALSGSPTRWRADTQRLRAIGFEPPKWSAGLARTVEWIRKDLSR